MHRKLSQNGGVKSKVAYVSALSALKTRLIGSDFDRQTQEIG